MFKDNGIDAVILEHNIDTHFTTFLEYKESGTKFVRIDSEIGDALKSEENNGSEESNNKLIDIFKDALGMEKLTIKAEALKTADTPAILTINEYERRMSDMQRIYGNMFGEMGKASETLIINTNNDIIKKLDTFEDEKRNLVCRHIFDLAVISQRKLSAAELEGFIARSVKIMDNL
jgi:molecular chaperone HtpG